MGHEEKKKHINAGTLFFLHPYFLHPVVDSELHRKFSIHEGTAFPKRAADYLKQRKAPQERPPVCPRFSCARSPSAVGRCPLTCI
eukprot:scaffold22126_cov70-Phaeocystis_antarctica.AAC.7